MKPSSLAHYRRHSSDDAILSGWFTYTSSDGHATSNAATATVANNATTATALVGTSGDDVIIATQGPESLSGGGGNDVPNRP
jgi:hypothetical protein